MRKALQVLELSQISVRRALNHHDDPEFNRLLAEGKDKAQTSLGVHGLAPHAILGRLNSAMRRELS